MKIRPISFAEAKRFVNENHRHNPIIGGCKFCIALYDGEQLHGVAICGRPVSRYLDDGITLEINRVCTDGAKNACSMLYGAAIRIAKDMGYKRVFTYTLQSESGSSVKASNFVLDASNVGGCHWTGKRYKQQNIPAELKNRWVKYL